MTAVRAGLLGVALLAALIAIPGRSEAQGPTLVLNPPAGDPPSVTGGLSGSGWCAGGTVTVSGGGVAGSARIPREGDLSGTFTVRGGTGQTVEVMVTADCAGTGTGAGGQRARAVFTFHAPPPTETPAPVPTPIPAVMVQPTVLPTAALPPSPTLLPPSLLVPSPTGAVVQVAPSPTPVPVPPPALSAAPPPAGEGPVARIPPTNGTLELLGCAVPPAEVRVEFTPLLLDPQGGAQPAAAGFVVPVSQGAEGPGSYTFSLSAVEPGTLYRVAPRVSDPGCSPAPSAGYWMAGKPFARSFAAAGTTSLWTLRSVGAHAIGSPCAGPGSVASHAASGGAGEFDVECWVADHGLYGNLSSTQQPFLWSTELSGVARAQLQASLWPFPPLREQDPLAAKVAATWDVSCSPAGCVCGDCPFSVALSPLWPDDASFIDEDTAAALAPNLNLLLPGAGDQTSGQSVQVAHPVLPPVKATNQLVAGGPVLPSPLAYYFRLVPLGADGRPAGAPSNTVRIQWLGEKTPSPGVLIGSTVLPPPQPAAHQADIVAYHGIIPAKKSKPCYVVIKTTTTSAVWVPGPGGLMPFPGPDITYPAGAPLCEPDPPDPPSCGLGSVGEVARCGNAVIDFLKDGWDWIADVFDDLNALVVKAVLKVTLLGDLCAELKAEATCEEYAGYALDAGLVYLGIPPDIPNFDELVGQGIEYLAAEAAAQMVIPPEVINLAVQKGGPAGAWLAAEADAALRSEAQQMFKEHLEQQLDQIQLSYAKKVDWLPLGVPVKPDPDSDIQPPALTVKITRNPAAPGACSALDNPSLLITSLVRNQFVGPAGQQQLGHFNDANSPAEGPDLIPGQTHYLYLSMGIPIACLEPGQSQVVPVVLKPHLNQQLPPHGWPASDQALSAWSTLYRGGVAEIYVDFLTPAGPVPGDVLTWPAAGSYTK